ncbi:MAG TPA: GIY-YIG nuclease family protein [Blastocatellia bacterium]|nr:GIY-YIG nuclease family protein [Blastocatellia bacterium]
MNKCHIIEEIKRTAVANGGKPLGHRKFSTETGIQYADWYGKHWARWSDALREAGFGSNAMQAAYDESLVFDKTIELIRKLGRFPAISDLLMARRRDSEFPSEKTFRRFGSKEQLAARIAEYCREKPGHDDVVGWCAERVSARPKMSEEDAEVPDREEKIATGFVYLMKSGRHYKIGRTVSVGSRERQLALKIPVPPTTVHTIETDDPSGVEAYWHRRFAEKRGEGEWFDLSPNDIKAFKRWKRIV